MMHQKAARLWLVVALSFRVAAKPTQVAYNDLKYRHLCTEVYRSTLCMTIRFPFEVPLQDDSVQYPYPVHDGFYKLTKPAVIIDGPLLEACRNDLKAPTIAERVHWCLESEASKRPNEVVVVFTRTSMTAKEDFYGTGSELQRMRMFDYFQDNDVVILGDSLSSAVTAAFSELLGTCSRPTATAMENYDLHMEYTCHPPALRVVDESTTTAWKRQLRSVMGANAGSDRSIRLGNLWYKPGVYDNEVSRNRWHVVNTTQPLPNLIRSKASLLRGKPGQDNAGLRPLSIIVQYPLAHAQNQHMIFESFPQIEYNQKRLVELIMNITTPAAQSDLATIGFQLTHLVAFDGFPQHFPTETSAYVATQHASEQAFLAGQGYEGWHPTMGSTCRGPLPHNNILTRINNHERRNFVNMGFDMRWYGQTWEFTNQFWWEEVMWAGGDALDCTHPRSPEAAGPRVLKYFIQAMADDAYELGHHR